MQMFGNKVDSETKPKWVVLTPHGEEIDVFGVWRILVQLWKHSMRDYRKGLLQIGQGLQWLGCPDVRVEHSCIIFSHPCTQKMFYCHRHRLRRLTILEVFAYNVLCDNPASDYEARSRSADVYHTIRNNLPVEIQRMINPLMSYYCQENGAFGLYWVIPFLYAMFHTALLWRVVPRDETLKVTDTVIKPTGLRSVQVHRFCAGDWNDLYSSICYMMRFQIKSFTNHVPDNHQLWINDWEVSMIESNCSTSTIVAEQERYIRLFRDDRRWHTGCYCHCFQ